MTPKIVRSSIFYHVRWAPCHCDKARPQFVGEGDPSSCQRGCYIKIMTVSVQLKKIIGRESQGVVAKTN
jgi:hypothetical protein